MIDLLQITNDPVFARRCDALDGMRLWVDLERLGKAERPIQSATYETHNEIIDALRARDRIAYTYLMSRHLEFGLKFVGEPSADKKATTPA